ncbi:MAG TPA: DeoR/GlpR family DNA-binding transcription regulator [Nocardioidaceae bacterium]|nr:DeoR/GlpR family DNA-binding transcription regulator [Nocardioidaceae bacterium]
MLAQRRYDRILDAVRADGPVEVRALAEQLRVSEATIRRDLNRMQRSGLIKRVRGGAALGTASEPSYAQVASRDHADKDAIATAAAGLVREGDVVLLDIGTTVHGLAAQLHGRSVTVVTSSLAVYEELAVDDAVELILLGGAVRRNYRSLVGFLTEHALRQIHAQRLFLGTSGIRPDGTVLDTTTVEVPLKQAMLRAVDEVVLLADPSKFPGSGLARVCGPGDVDVLVCRAPDDDSTPSAFEDAGCRVVHA